MKNVKRFLLILLSLALILTLLACSGNKCKEHSDADKDGKCDKCGETVELEETRLLLYNEGEPTFQFVLADRTPKAVKELINDYIDNMDGYDIKLEAVADEEDTVTECEILIGDIKSRGEKYMYDIHTLGKDGYVIKLIDSKIVVTGGSDDALEKAVGELIDDILLYDEDADEIATVYMSESQNVIETTEYAITSVKVSGNDIKDYTIATDLKSAIYKSAAQDLQSVLYDRAGYWVDIVDIASADASKSIVIKHIDKVAGEGGFKITAAESGQLVIECMYDNKLASALSSFLTQKITLSKESEINLTGSVYAEDISVLTYEEFGAKGDGETDDFQALYETHVEANEYGQVVKAKSGAKYYIKENKIFDGAKMVAASIPIKTNVDWTGAYFIIDDSDLNMFDSDDRDMGNLDIFVPTSDYDVVTISDKTILQKVVAAGLNRSTTKIDLGLGYPAMIVPYNSKHKVYRRKGYGGYEGGAMHEVIVIDAEGNIDLTSDSQTPVMFKYTELDYIEVYRLDMEHITIKGGTVTHMGHRVDAEYYNPETQLEVQMGYIARGLNVKRSYTTVDGLVHKIENEITPKEFLAGKTSTDSTGFQGAPYHGFFYAKNATDVTFKNCTLQGRRYYNVQGTYDFGANTVNKIVLDGCTQSNFWVIYDEAQDKFTNVSSDTPGKLPSMGSVRVDGTDISICWGIGGTNYCKNMEYLNSTLSRYDAHAGLYNGKVINSTVNYLSLTGNGDFIVENVTWYTEGTSYNSHSIFHLREDYGSTWEGTITVKDMRAYIHTSVPAYLIMHQYRNWYYGYQSHFPNLDIENLDFYNYDTSAAIPAGYRIYLMGSSLNGEPGMHLSVTNGTSAVHPYVDYNEDGLVDNTDVEYSEAQKPYSWHGITVENKTNLNPIGTPDIIRIVKNDGVDGAGGYQYIIPKTHGTANTADSGVTLPDGAAADGGFFGATRFIWGEGENDYYIGTNQGGNETFVFTPMS